MLTLCPYHCQHLEDFVGTAADTGFIYVSMGTSVKTANMPDTLAHLFLETFAKLPYRVLWKYEGKIKSQELPPNVKVERWLPQQDVLGKDLVKSREDGDSN